MKYKCDICIHCHYYMHIINIAYKKNPYKTNLNNLL